MSSFVIRRSASALGLTLAATLVPAVAAGTAAAAPSQRTLLEVSPKAASVLRAPGLRVTAAGAATGGAGRIVLPVRSAGAGARPAVAHAPAAGLRLRLRGRSVVVRGLRVLPGGAAVSARVGSRSVRLLALSGVRSRATRSVRTVSSRVALTPAGARALRTALRAPRLRAGALGTMRTTVRVAAPATSAPAPATPAAPAAPATPVTPAAPATPAAPVVPPAPEAPPVPADPVVSTPGLDWTVRGSWLSYLAAGNGRVESTGAERLPSGAYAFPAVAGSVDGAGRGTFETSGAVRFVQEAHYIDMEFADFRFVLDGGPTPTVTALYTDRNTLPGEPYDGVPRRIDFGTLALEGITPERQGDVLVYRRVPVQLSEEAAKPFLYYKTGESFGAMTLRVPVAD